jgi:hypothetical protein
MTRAYDPDGYAAILLDHVTDEMVAASTAGSWEHVAVHHDPQGRARVVLRWRRRPPPLDLVPTSRAVVRPGAVAIRAFLGPQDPEQLREAIEAVAARRAR